MKKLVLLSIFLLLSWHSAEGQQVKTVTSYPFPFNLGNLTDWGQFHI